MAYLKTNQNYQYKMKSNQTGINDKYLIDFLKKGRTGMTKKLETIGKSKSDFAYTGDPIFITARTPQNNISIVVFEIPTTNGKINVERKMKVEVGKETNKSTSVESTTKSNKGEIDDPVKKEAFENKVINFLDREVLGVDLSPREINGLISNYPKSFPDELTKFVVVGSGKKTWVRINKKGNKYCAEATIIVKLSGYDPSTKTIKDYAYGFGEFARIGVEMYEGDSKLKVTKIISQDKLKKVSPEAMELESKAVKLLKQSAGKANINAANRLISNFPQRFPYTTKDKDMYLSVVVNNTGNDNDWGVNIKKKGGKYFAEATILIKFTGYSASDRMFGRSPYTETFARMKIEMSENDSKFKMISIDEDKLRTSSGGGGPRPQSLLRNPSAINYWKARGY